MPINSGSICHLIIWGQCGVIIPIEKASGSAILQAGLCWVDQRPEWPTKAHSVESCCLCKMAKTHWQRTNVTLLPPISTCPLGKYERVVCQTTTVHYLLYNAHQLPYPLARIPSLCRMWSQAKALSSPPILSHDNWLNCYSLRWIHKTFLFTMYRMKERLTISPQTVAIYQRFEGDISPRIHAMMFWTILTIAPRRSILHSIIGCGDEIVGQNKLEMQSTRSDPLPSLYK